MLYGTTNWTALALHMIDPESGVSSRTGKQCRERWHNHLNPGISKVDWTFQEDASIVYLQKKWGNQWAKIAKYLPGRSDNAVKNRYHATCRSKYQNVDFSSLNLPLFVEDATPVVESTGRPSTGSNWSGKTSEEEEEVYGSEDELDFDQHVQKIKNYTASMAVPVPNQGHEQGDGADAAYLRDDIATSPLTNTSMSLGELALDEMMDEEGEEDQQQGMVGLTGAIMVEPLNFSSYQWGSNQFDSSACSNEEAQSNGFCGQWSAPVAGFSSTMASMCDFGSSYNESSEDYYADAEPAFVCDVVEAAPAQHYQQQQQQFFSPSMAFCAPRR